jgi:hypothetical protein
MFLYQPLPYQPWYDPETDPSQFMAALSKVRHLCTRAEHVRMTMPGSPILVQAIMSAIDDYMRSARPATANTFGVGRIRRGDDV